MHNNGFVLCLKDSAGRVLRETSGVVHLPFHSEYSLLIKNLTPKRACCSVTIDGTDVLGFQELILEPNSTVPLERFLVDGDMSKGNRFKFVPLSDSRVQDPSASNNGLVVVTFWYELEPIYWVPPVTTKIWPNSGTYYSGGVSDFTSASPLRSVTAFACNAAAAGATVEGSVSHQKFGSGVFTKGNYATTISLRLMSAVQPVTVTTAIHCTSCGRKARHNDSYCGGCGTKIS